MKKSNFVNILNTTFFKTPDNQELANIFLSNSNQIKRYIIGKNDQAKEIIKYFTVDGIIDDFDNNNFWNGIPIKKISELPLNSVVVSCSTSISPVSVIKNLKNSNVKNIISFNELQYASKGKLHLPAFVREFRDEYNNRLEQWFSIYEKMDDQESKQTLIDAMRFRLTGDSSYMNNYKVRIKDQYMEDFLKLSNEVFVDIGGFDGDTTDEFCNRYPDYKKVIFFEPSSKNMSLAKERLLDFDNITFKPFGLSNNNETLSFDPYAGSASTILPPEESENTIKVVKLDDEIKEEVSFIKMDIEGWEMKALAGAKNSILKDKPKLAIAVYHQASDFRNVFNFILGIHPDYKVYLRHYTQGWSETIMFFV